MPAEDQAGRALALRARRGAVPTCTPAGLSQATTVCGRGTGVRGCQLPLGREGGLGRHLRFGARLPGHSAPPRAALEELPPPAAQLPHLKGRSHPPAVTEKATHDPCESTVRQPLSGAGEIVRGVGTTAVGFGSGETVWAQLQIQQAEGGVYSQGAGRGRGRGGRGPWMENY